MKPVHFNFLIPATITILVLLAMFSWFEITNSQKEMMELLIDQSHTLLETIVRAGENTLASNDFVEQLIIEDLLATAIAVRDRFEDGRLTQPSIEQIAESTNAFRISVFDRNCTRLFQSMVRDTLEHQRGIENRSPCQTLDPIFRGKQDTLVIGLQQARYGDGVRLAVAVAAYGRTAVVVNVDAARVINFRKIIGFGKLLQSITASEKIHYIVLQDTAGLIAKAGHEHGLESINGSQFLSGALTNATFAYRIIQPDSVKIFEAVNPLTYMGVTVGLIRTGLSLAPFEVITKKVLLRVVIIVVISGLFICALIFAVAYSARFEALRGQYQEVETHVNAIVQQTTDVIIVLDEHRKITMFNNAAEKLFQKKADILIGSEIKNILDKEQSKCVQIIESISGMETIHCVIKGVEFVLLVSKSHVPLSGERFSTVLIIRDITDTKRLEESIERRERAEMTGQFASAVAHEIRNPLNTLSMSLQQLRTDFVPLERKEIYEQLTQLLISETDRINRTVQSFLDFSRPAPLKPEKFEIQLFLTDVLHQFEATARAHNIKMKQHLFWTGTVLWDRDTIRQVLINLYRNATEAMESGGTIKVTVAHVNSFIEIIVADTGPGIPPDHLTRIFGLYYTTKAGGSGLGLSIVQRIIDEHGGTISVRNDGGAVFTLRIPVMLNHIDSKEVT